MFTGGHDYVACIPVGELIESSCPITSMVFDIENLFDYEQALYEPVTSLDGNSLFYISRKVM